MFKKVLLLLGSLFVTSNTLASNKESMDIAFSPNEDVHKLAEAYSLDCLDFVKDKFNLTLDWSNKSVAELEPILASLSNYIKAKSMSPEDQDGFAKMFGFYIGEVYRKNHQDKVWGVVTIQGQKYHAIGSKSTSRAIMWPVANVQKRITVGEEANIANYYSALIGE